MDERYQQTAKLAKEVSPERPARSFTEMSKPSIAPSKNTRPKILLVEDNVINAKVLSRQLKLRGYQVMTANNGQEAIDMSKRISSDRASWEKPQREVHDPAYMSVFDIILMDHEM